MRSLWATAAMLGGLMAAGIGGMAAGNCARAVLTGGELTWEVGACLGAGAGAVAVGGIVAYGAFKDALRRGRD